MKDPVTKFHERGLACTFVGEEQKDMTTITNVLCGQCQLVYMSPEKCREIFVDYLVLNLIPIVEYP